MIHPVWVEKLAEEESMMQWRYKKEDYYNGKSMESYVYKVFNWADSRQRHAAWADARAWDYKLLEKWTEDNKYKISTEMIIL